MPVNLPTWMKQRKLSERQKLTKHIQEEKENL